MSGLFFKKQDQELKFEILPVKIPALNAYFDPVSGKWIDYDNMESQKKDSDSRLILETYKDIESRLIEGVARKIIQIENAKKEILMTLQDHQDLLTPQGLDTASLINTLKS